MQLRTWGWGNTLSTGLYFCLPHGQINRCVCIRRFACIHPVSHQLGKNLSCECLGQAVYRMTSFTLGAAGARVGRTAGASSVGVKAVTPTGARIFVSFITVCLQSGYGQIHLRVSLVKQQKSSPFIKSLPESTPFQYSVWQRGSTYAHRSPASAHTASCLWGADWATAFSGNTDFVFVWQTHCWKQGCHFKENNCNICCQCWYI